MLFLVFAFVGVVALFIWPVTRPFAVAGSIALAGYIYYDNYVTERELPRADFEVRSAKLHAMSPDDSVPLTYLLSVKFKNDHPTAQLENATLRLSLYDCLRRCRLIGRQDQELQLLARPGQVREAEAWYRFDHIVRRRGELRAHLEVTSATGDWG